MDKLVGIERINIIDTTREGRGAYRFNVAKPFITYINHVYRYCFDLEEGDVITNVSIDDKLGRYDVEFGVDVILRLKNGQPMTVQEKVLTTKYNTVTIEYHQNKITKEIGDWFKLKCNLYFVGYSGGNKERLDRFILLDFNQIKILSNLGVIKWSGPIPNTKDGALSNFVCVKFDDLLKYPVIKEQCVLACKYRGDNYINRCLIDTCGCDEYVQDIIDKAVGEER
jgi:hypothetical protein